MGGLFSSPAPAMPAPPMPPPVPPAAIPSTMANGSVKAAGQQVRNQAGAIGANGGTLKTTPQGDLVAPPTAKARLLGETV